MALEARLINRTKPPLNVLLKEAPRPDAALIVGLMDPGGPKEVPRFFMTTRGTKRGFSLVGKKLKSAPATAGLIATGRVVTGWGTTVSAGG